MRTIIVVAALLATGWLSACDRTPRGITIEGAWSRATPPGASVGVVYFDITNHSAQPDRLTGVSSPGAARAELHETTLSGGMMRMSALDSVELPLARTLSFAPEGRHVMLVGLSAPLVAGSRISVTLSFEHAAPQTVQVPVLALDALAPLEH